MILQILQAVRNLILCASIVINENLQVVMLIIFFGMIAMFAVNGITFIVCLETITPLND